jgi:hypothetical protein
MSDVKSEATSLLAAQKRSIDDLHQKLAAMAGANKERLAYAVDKLKAAHQVFEDDALNSVSGQG